MDQLNTWCFTQGLLGLLAGTHVSVCKITKAIWAKQRHVHGAHQRDERFVRADIGSGSVAANVLLSC